MRSPAAGTRAESAFAHANRKTVHRTFPIDENLAPEDRKTRLRDAWHLQIAPGVWARSYPATHPPRSPGCSLRRAFPALRSARPPSSQSGLPIQGTGAVPPLPLPTCLNHLAHPVAGRLARTARHGRRADAAAGCLPGTGQESAIDKSVHRPADGVQPPARCTVHAPGEIWNWLDSPGDRRLQNGGGEGEKKLPGAAARRWLVRRHYQPPGHCGGKAPTHALRGRSQRFVRARLVSVG